MDRAVFRHSPWLSQQRNYTCVCVGYVGRPCILKSWGGGGGTERDGRRGFSGHCHLLFLPVLNKGKVPYFFVRLSRTIIVFGLIIHLRPGNLSIVGSAPLRSEIEGPITIFGPYSKNMANINPFSIIGYLHRKCPARLLQLRVIFLFPPNMFSCILQS